MTNKSEVALSALEEVPVLVTVAEAATILTISKPNAYRLIRCGALGSVQLGGKSTRVARSQLVDFIISRVAQPSR